jgi:hypothetical protein
VAKEIAFFRYLVAFIMTIKVFSKTLVLGPTTRNACAGSQSAIHLKRTGRRRARVTYRTHVHRRAARNTCRGRREFVCEQTANTISSLGVGHACDTEGDPDHEEQVC